MVGAAGRSFFEGKRDKGQGSSSYMDEIIVIGWELSSYLPFYSKLISDVRF